MNKFCLLSCRFHVKDKRKLILQGYFDKADQAIDVPFFTLDYTMLSCQVIEKTYVRNPAECMGGIYDRRYFFMLDIPEDYDKYKELRCFQYEDEKSGEVFHLGVDWIKKQEEKREWYIDEVTWKNQAFCIRGWCVCQKDATLYVSTQKNKSLPVRTVRRVERLDVERAFPECTREEIYGFEITGTAKKKKLWLAVEDAYGAHWRKVSLRGRWQDGGLFRLREWQRKIKVYYQQFGLRQTIRRVGEKLLGMPEEDYGKWRSKNGSCGGRLGEEKEEPLTYTPSFGIVVPLYRTPERYLEEMIASVQKQTYSNWKLYLSDGSGEKSPLRSKLEKYAKKDSRIVVLHNEKQLRIVENTNVALEEVKEDYVVFMDHDDTLAPEALYECAKVLNGKPETDVIYTDEDKITEDSKKYFQPHFKSDMNLDLLRSQNYICHLFVVRRTLQQKVGLLRAEYEGSQDYDFILRCVEQTDKIVHIPKILYHWRAHADSTAENPSSKEYAYVAGRKAIEAHYKRMNIDAEVAMEYWGIYRTKYRMTERPLISIIIPNKDHTDDLKRCIKSIEENRNGLNVEYIIVENNSEEEKTFLFYEDLRKWKLNLQILEWNGVFNYSAINNYAVEHANGNYILLLNNDTEIINAECLEELLSYCMREDTGIVGARLFYPDDTIQHAGTILGLGGIAGHAFVGKKADDLAYFGRVICAQQYSAVTAACMMVKKSVYEEVGGLDEAFEVAFNDVDFCMRVGKAGYKVVYNPYAMLYHYESKTRGIDDTEEKIQRFQGEINLFANRWKKELALGDPFYNPNLTLMKSDFSLRT